MAKTKASSEKPTNGQKSIKSFLFKTKKNSFSNQKSFVAEKIIDAVTGVQKLTQEEAGAVVQNVVRKDAVSEDIENHESKVNSSECEKINQKELKYAKVLLKKSSEINMQKDLQIQQLKQQLKQKLNECSNKTLLFVEYEGKFDLDDLKEIRSVRPGPAKDSNFILKVMRGLYKDGEISKLFDRSAAGRANKGVKKSCITPEKGKIIEDMLHQRILSEIEIEDLDFEKRSKKLNRFIRSAIYNMKSAFKKRDSGPFAIENQNDQLNVEHIQSSLSTPQIVQTVTEHQNDQLIVDNIQSSTPQTVQTVIEQQTGQQMRENIQYFAPQTVQPILQSFQPPVYPYQFYQPYHMQSPYHSYLQQQRQQQHQYTEHFIQNLPFSEF